MNVVCVKASKGDIAGREPAPCEKQRIHDDMVFLNHNSFIRPSPTRPYCTSATAPHTAPHTPQYALQEFQAKFHSLDSTRPTRGRLGSGISNCARTRHTRGRRPRTDSRIQRFPQWIPFISWPFFTRPVLTRTVLRGSVPHKDVSSRSASLRCREDRVNHPFPSLGPTHRSLRVPISASGRHPRMSRMGPPRGARHFRAPRSPCTLHHF